MTFYLVYYRMQSVLPPVCSHVKCLIVEGETLGAGENFLIWTRIFLSMCPRSLSSALWLVWVTDESFKDKDTKASCSVPSLVYIGKWLLPWSLYNVDVSQFIWSGVSEGFSNSLSANRGFLNAMSLNIPANTEVSVLVNFRYSMQEDSSNTFPGVWSST